MPVFFTVRTRGPKNARYAGDCHPGRARAPNSPRDIEMNRKTAAVTAAVVTALISIVAIHIVRGQVPEVALEVNAATTAAVTAAALRFISMSLGELGARAR